MTARQKLIAVLELAGDQGATTAEILEAGVGSRYGARILELRAEGYEIGAARVREGSWRYRLITKPAHLREPQGEPEPMRLFEPARRPAMFDPELA